MARLTLPSCMIALTACVPVGTQWETAEQAEHNVLPAGDEDPLALDFDAASFKSETKLLTKLRASPFAYFRYLAAPFVKTICDAPDSSTPIVSLHGDLHLEQYAIADDGFGIVDFDDATKGPAIIDWLRFTTSLWVANQGDEAATSEAIAEFVEGYREGLENPDAVMSAPEPSVAKRVRTSCTATPSQWLDHVSSLIQPLDPGGIEKMKHAREIYIKAMLAQNPELDEGFFALKAGGALQMGIGSAHEKKFLVRVEGPTKSPDDDVILEKKQMKKDVLGRCVTGDVADPTRVVAAQRKYSRAPQRLLGYIEVDGESYYVQSWRVHYTELKVSDLHGAKELAEIAFDVGLQLGRGHPLAEFNTPEGKAEREQLRRAIDRVAPSLVERSRTLAARTLRGYERFRASSAPAQTDEAAVTVVRRAD